MKRKQRGAIDIDIDSRDVMFGLIIITFLIMMAIGISSIGNHQPPTPAEAEIAKAAIEKGLVQNADGKWVLPKSSQ